MGGTASSASQPHLMPPGPAGIKPGGATSLRGGGMLATRWWRAQICGLLPCCEMLGVGGQYQG